jgi:hypothetical protein
MVKLIGGRRGSMERKGRMAGWLRRRPRPDEATVRDRRAAELMEFTARGWPVAPAARPLNYGCSCDRVGCPSPGMHPESFAWQTQASADPMQVARWLERYPDANFIAPTGIAHDVLDAPAAAGEIALQVLDEAGVDPGPVALSGPDRMLFFTVTRGTPQDEDEWWPCELDCHPEALDDHPGLRWHSRGSYVVIPPSMHPSGSPVSWMRGPHLPLPDPLRVLDVLTDACDTVGAGAADGHWLMGM